eukprot:CAMPEP_0204314988 /NCGR_PEP_ID=MMETSP0469-20131031/4560_1 /ASSEMBLY_ACC=CAM_ASM_000384 /TAXON_ID=2969 /ORGANISM="Oxyrrhis marina" /LENGTH=106 /DNA_ID=CAMNT_0051295571 /DNA_START=99 /DNA_END=417 /DNA_ORIENTATION=+
MSNALRGAPWDPRFARYTSSCPSPCANAPRGAPWGSRPPDTRSIIKWVTCSGVLLTAAGSPVTRTDVWADVGGAKQVLFEGVPTHPTQGRFWEVVDKYSVTQFYTA